VGQSDLGYRPCCQRVGVFVDEAISQVCRIAADFAIDYIQLHGSESPQYLSELRTACSASGCATAAPRLVKAFNISTADDLAQTADYSGLADLFLFDTKGKSVGGNGEKFDWSVLSSYDGDTPFLLSGGIGPHDASLINAFHHPRCIGIDLNSRFETAPGLKDVDALRKFLEELNRK
jgi:phosphoribosylanthranilate isomerase